MNGWNEITAGGRKKSPKVDAGGLAAGGLQIDKYNYMRVAGRTTKYVKNIYFNYPIWYIEVS